MMTTELSDIRQILENRDLLAHFSGKTVLVTGSTGLIGSMLVKTLAEARRSLGLDIRVLAHARSEARAKEVLGSAMDGVSMVYAEDFSFRVPCDIIFHTASPTKSRYFIEHPVESIDAILTGTRAMLELARENGAEMIYLSSMEEYGVPYSPGERMTEDKVGVIDHLTPRSCYPEGKRMCECMCAAYASEYGVDARMARLAQTFGAGIPVSDNRVSMQFAKSALERRDIVLHTEGRSVSNFCYLTDAITGLFAIAARGAAGEAYNVCNAGETRSIFEIATLVAEKVAGGSIRVVKDIPENANFGYAPDNTMYLSADKLMGIGWTPVVSMEEGYRRLVRYLREHAEGGHDNMEVC